MRPKHGQQLKKPLNKLATSQHSILSNILGIQLNDRVSLAKIKIKTNFKNVTAIVKQMKFTNAGHIIRGQEGKWNRILPTRIPHNGRRGRGRPTPQWEDDLNKLFGSNWKSKAKNRRLWKDLVAANTQQWVTEGVADEGDPLLTLLKSYL